jgi:PAS domain S-box-containing protein
MLSFLQKIKLKFYIFFGIIALGFVILLISIFSTITKVKKYHELQSELYKLESSSVKVKNSFHDLILRYYTSSEFFENTQDPLSLLVAENYLEVQRSLDIIASHPFMNNNQEEADNIYEIRELAKQFYDQYKSFLDILKAKGNADYGFVKSWNDAFDNLVSSCVASVNSELIKMLSDIKLFQTQYLLTKDQVVIDDILNTTNNLKSLIDADVQAGIIDPSAYEVLNNYVDLTGKVFQQDLLIGTSTESGLMETITVSISQVSQKINILAANYEADFARYKNSSVASLLIFLIIIFGALTGTIVYLFFEVRDPVDKLESAFRQLSQGVIPEKFEIKYKNEFQSIAGNLRIFLEDLRLKTTLASDVIKGDYEATYSPLSQDDMLGMELLTLKQNLQEAHRVDEDRKAEDEKRRWLSEGIAKFGDLLRQKNDNLDELSIAVIQNLVKYLNINQGGLFIYNEEEKNLDLRSMFAFNRQKYIKKKISMGEGMVGSVAIEKKTVYLTEIPSNYLEVTSGLGDSKPSSILIVPLIVDNQILGVVELASFKFFGAHEIEFVEHVAESIAATIASVKVNEKTTKLLQQSQRQAQEMAEQEEEMRQNMEELQATQEEFGRREQEINSLQLAIQNSAFYAEYDTKGCILNINENYLSLAEANKAHAIGMHHSDFASMDRNSQSYIELWNSLLKGKMITKDERVRLLNNKEIWFSSNYAPVLNNKSEVYKIICISIDITELKQKELSIERHSREIARKNDEIELLQVAIDESIIKCDIAPDGSIIKGNENFAKMMGYQLHEISGKMMNSLLNDEEREVFHAFWVDLLENKPHKSMFKRTKPDGDVRWVMATFTPVTNERDEIYKIYFLGQDITQEQQRYDLLVTANKEIERLTKLLQQHNIASK